MKLFRWLLLFALASPLMAQNVRWDLPIYTVQASGGNLLPVYAIPGALVSFYNEPAGTLATTYNSATSTSACPTGAQVVLNGSGACVSSADQYGNMGGWFLPGQYMATIIGGGKSYNYYFTIGSGSGIIAPVNYVGPVINVLTQGVVAGGSPGSSLPTDTANTAAIQAAITLAVATGSELYFPCGIYNINSPITMLATRSSPIVGQSSQCSVIQYTGSGSQSAGMLSVASGSFSPGCTSVTSPVTDCGNPGGNNAGFVLKDISLVANANVPDGLDLIGSSSPILQNANIIGAADADVFCMACGSGGSWHNIGLSAGEVYGFNSVNNTPNGLVFDGYSIGAAANKLIIDSPGAAGMPGSAILVRTYTTSLQFENCQLSGNLYNIQVTGGSGNLFENCLSEGGGLGGETLVASAATGTTFIAPSSSGSFIVDGPQTRISGGSASLLTINSTATGTVVDGISMVGSTIVNNNYDTEFRAILNAATNDFVYNFPAWRRVPVGALGANSGALYLNGTWTVPSAGTFQAFDPTPLAVTTTPWRLIISGRVFGSSGVGAFPTRMEFSDTVPTQTLPGGGTMTVSITGGLIGYATSGTGGSTIVFGEVDFLPGVTSDSASFAGNVKLPSLQVNGGTAMTNSHGTGTYAQESDGTGTGGNLAKYSSDGSVTNGPTSPSGAVVGTTDTQTLTNKTVNGVSPSLSLAGSTASTGQAACIYAAGPPIVIGHCTGVVGSGGACTCSN